MARYVRRYNGPPKPARWMELRYDGSCHVCGSAIVAGTRGFYDPESREVTCTDMVCAEKDGLTTEVLSWPNTYTKRLNTHRVGPRAPSVTPTRVTTTRFNSGAVEYRNSRGRCEDAPCCGCCS